MSSSKTPGWDSLPKYKSPYGPKYHYQPNIAGVSLKQLARFGLKTGYFGAVGLFAVIYFASGVPRVEKDIMQKLPFIGHRFVHTVPASDNPF
ncbi:ubiquinol-cytochrome-c reductase complex subunit-domain-containing protein [Coniochaeta sp. 2T2.1]|nr:ubiquinol-cytochrome-c reductase complex subunit-domain-containing protein [Coniochaeta sp. 2T2.1]